MHPTDDGKRVAIMQPYVFPYLGYFHLIESSSVFVFYDDVNYIKGGWINRNRLSHGGEAIMFTVPVASASPNQAIENTQQAINPRWHRKFFARVAQAYSGAPYYEPVCALLHATFDTPAPSIAQVASDSIERVYSYLGIERDFLRSSICATGSRGRGRAERLVAITREQGLSTYINAAAGRELYSAADFAPHGVALTFVRSNPVEYSQGGAAFIPDLSIIDVLMYNPVQRVRELLRCYEVEV